MANVTQWFINRRLIRPLNKGQGHSFGTNRFLIGDIL